MILWEMISYEMNTKSKEFLNLYNFDKESFISLIDFLILALKIFN